jgi:hypothetical protein
MQNTLLQGLERGKKYVKMIVLARCWNVQLIVYDPPTGGE